jgi:predicted small metal-binding protein
VTHNPTIIDRLVRQAQCGQGGRPVGAFACRHRQGEGDGGNGRMPGACPLAKPWPHGGRNADTLKGTAMATTYKQLTCRDAGADCDFLVRAETEEEVLAVAGGHGKRVHGYTDISPEMLTAMKGIIKTVPIR